MAKRKAKKASKKKSTRKSKKRANVAKDTKSKKPEIKLASSTKSKLFNVRHCKLGSPQHTQTLAVLSRAQSSGAQNMCAPMPVRMAYSKKELAAKSTAGVSASATSVRASARNIEIPTTAASVPPQLVATNSGAITTKVGDMSLFPYSAIGKVNFTVAQVDAFGNVIPVGQTISWEGTGFVVGARTVYTAAHVIEERLVDNSGVQYHMTSAIFRPQHPAPVKSWVCTDTVIHSNYITDGSGMSKINRNPELLPATQFPPLPGQFADNTSTKFDLGAIITDPNDIAIGSVMGTIGWKVNAPMPASCEGIGYPSNPPTSFGFDGNTMWKSAGTIRVDNQFLDTSGNPIFTMRDNDLTRGGSGGPAIINEGGTNGFRAVGLNSHVRGFPQGHPLHPQIDWSQQISPIFDDDFLEVLKGVKEIELAINAGVPENSPNYKRLL